MRAQGIAARPAGFARQAGQVDLGGHPLAHQGRVFGLVDDAHKLVAHDPLELGIAAQHLQIGVANAGQQDAEAHLARRRDGKGAVNLQSGGLAGRVKDDGFHGRPQRREP